MEQEHEENGGRRAGTTGRWKNRRRFLGGVIEKDGRVVPTLYEGNFSARAGGAEPAYGGRADCGGGVGPRGEPRGALPE